MNSDISIESNITVITLVLEASLAVKIVRPGG
jgi:hypothetical protein